MAKKGAEHVIIGKWLFIIGILLVLVGEWIPYTVVILVILGLVIGFLNITKEEIPRLIIAGVGLLIVGTLGIELLPALGSYVTNVLKNLAILIIPIVLVISIKEIYLVAKR